MKKLAGDTIILHLCTKNHNHIMHSSWDTEWDRLIVILGLFCPFIPSLTVPKIKILKKNEKMPRVIIYLYIQVYHKWRSYNHTIYGSWNIRCDRRKFLSFWAIFCPFSPLTTWKIKIIILKKTLGDIIILHICIINDNHMMYGFSDMECNGLNFLLFWTVFCPFTLLATWKNHLKTLSFYTGGT